jgi:DNA-binding MarR family transcriptional regulator
MSSREHDPFAGVSEPVRVFRLVLVAAQQLRYVMDRRLAEADLTTQQAMLLSVLDVLGGSALLGEAAEKLQMTHQNAKQLATSLQTKGFLTIDVDENDGRARRLRPTAHSRRFWKQRDGADERALAELMSELSETELATLSRLLKKVVRAADGACRELRER